MAVFKDFINQLNSCTYIRHSCHVKSTTINNAEWSVGIYMKNKYEQ